MTRQEFESRVRACTPQLWRCAWAILGREADCADAVQEALLRAWRKLGGLREERYFETWLTRILINESRAILRRRTRSAPMEAIADRAAPRDGLSPELRDAIDRLPLHQRLPFLLRFIGGYEIAEIARMQGVSYAAARHRIDAARRALRSALEEKV